MADMPIGGRSFGASIPFSSMRSNNPIEKLSTPHRRDPFWDALWRIGQMPLWDERTALDMRLASGVEKIGVRSRVAPGVERAPRAAMVADADECIDRRLTGTRQRTTTLDIMGVLDQWRTATDEQVGAIIGSTGLTNEKNAAVFDMFASSLLDIGYVGGARALRPSASNAFDKKVRPRITYPEWVSITGGTPMDSGRQYTRHNLLATELGLRLAEYAEVEAVLGEKLATHELLGHTGIGYSEPERAMLAAADLVVVREDGMRIAIEITASGGTTLLAKVRRWAKLLSDRRMSKSGLAVIFLSAAPPDITARKRWSTRNNAFRSVGIATREFPGVSFDRTAARIGVADWREWFPERHAMSSEFLPMTVDVATGEPQSPWQRRSFLDMFDDENGLVFQPDEPQSFLDALDNMAALRGNPHWLRKRRTAPDLTSAMLARSDYAGLDLRSLQRPQTEEQSRWFPEWNLPPKRLRS